MRLSTSLMQLDVSRRLTGDLTTGSALRLTLEGAFGRRVSASIDGRPATVMRVASNLVTIAVPAGHHSLTVSPR